MALIVSSMLVNKRIDLFALSLTGRVKWLSKWQISEFVSQIQKKKQHTNKGANTTYDVDLYCKYSFVYGFPSFDIDKTIKRCTRETIE